MKINESAHKKLSKAIAIYAMESAMKETMIELRDTFAQKPTPKKTGNLRRSNTYEVNNSGGKITGRVKNSAPYWFWVNFGHHRYTGAHFLEQGVDKVQPSKKIAENFKKKMGQK